MTSGSPPIRVLFVEDAFDQALLVQAFLASAGDFDVTHAQDGDRAAVLLREQEWDLLITDLNLPGLDGFELIRMCRQLHPDVPVMATTGYTGTHYQEEAFRAGVSDMILKPIEKGDFLARIAKLVGEQETATLTQATVLAIGGLVGDVEMGCGGSLVQWAAEGKSVYILPICQDELDATDAGVRGARAAAAVLGATAVIDEEAMQSTSLRVGLVERMVRQHDPEILYVPSMDDDHPARREAFRIAKATAGPVSTVLAYQTATTGLDFHPAKFVDISQQLAIKMEALEAYDGAGATRLDLSPRMAEAYARYWGRLARFTETEALEILKGD